MADKPEQKADKVYFRDAMGMAASAPADTAEDLSQFALQPIGQEEALRSAQAQKDLQYVDQNWGAAGKLGMGALSGLSLGLAPGILAQQGLLDPRHLQAAQASPWYTAGDIGGMVAPALLSGGESLAAQGLRATPAGLMTLGGDVVERAAAGMFSEAPGLLGRAASVPLKMAARGAAEGAIMNLSHQVGENLVQNKPFAAEALAALSDGALYGGLFGGGLGTAGAIGEAAIDGAGKFAKRIASGGGDASAVARVGKKIGYEASADEITSGAAKSKLKDMGEYIERGGSSVGDTPLNQYKAIQKETATQTAVRESAIETLDKQAPSFVPSFNRIEGRADIEILAPSSMTPNYSQVSKEWNQVRGELENIWAHQDVPSFRPEVMDRKAYEHTESQKPLHQQRPYEAYKTENSYEIPGMHVATGEKPTWEQLVRFRDEFAEKALTPVRKDVLNIIDSEIDSALQGAVKHVPEVEAAGKEYAASTMALKIGRELEANIGALVNKSVPSVGGLRFRDLAGSAVVAATGHPITAAAWMANKGLSGMGAGRIEGLMAQMAYDSSIASKAAEASIRAKSKISESLGKFFKATTKTPSKAGTKVTTDRVRNSKDYNQGWDRSKYEAETSRIQNLLADNHMQRVQRQAEEIHNQGYPELAAAMMALNQRAVLYAMNSMPSRKGSKNIASLRPQAVSKVLDMDEHRFKRIVKGIQQPLSLLDDLVDGSLSRDSVRAAWNVNPELRSELAYQASEKIMEMKANGDSLPLEKVAMLGILLDAPVDSMLRPEYVNEVQVALNAPPPAPSGGPAPIGPANMTVEQTGLMTPLQQNAMG